MLLDAASMFTHWISLQKFVMGNITETQFVYFLCKFKSRQVTYLNAGTRKVAELDSIIVARPRTIEVVVCSSSSKDMARRFLRMLSHLS